MNLLQEGAAQKASPVYVFPLGRRIGRAVELTDATVYAMTLVNSVRFRFPDNGQSPSLRTVTERLANWGYLWRARSATM
jgi:hypothetical protein